MPAADQANASQADPPGLTVSVSVSASQHLIIEVLPRPVEFTLIGHSGGAAIAANLIGRHPGLVDAAVLASCPCDVPRWRAHMKERLGGRVWDEAVRSLSPHLLADGIGRETLVRIVVGVEDDNTLPAYSREYAGRLRRLGIDVELTELEGRRHDILMEPEVLAIIGALLAS